MQFPPTPNNANTYLPPVVVIPGALVITAITNAFPMAVSFTNTLANTYIPGMLVRMFIPKNYGMQQANGLTLQILSVDDVNYIFTLNIDSTNFDLFIVPTPGPTVEQPATMSPAGSMNLSYSNSTNQVAFQNLNNVGN
jgi:hypothetical protein